MATTHPILVQVSGTEIEDVLPIQRFPFTIGRNAGFGNDLLLRDPRVKRNHARIENADESFVIIDLDSTHFTWLNGVIVERAVLHHGDVISIGRTSLVFLEHLDRHAIFMAIRRASGYVGFQRNDQPAVLN